MGAINNVLRILASWSEWWTSPIQIKKREESDVEGRVADMNKAIKNKDVDEVNIRIQKHLMKIILVGLLFSYGCVTPIYVPAQEKAVPLRMNGVDGWFVPDSVFARIMEKSERWDAYQKGVK